MWFWLLVIGGFLKSVHWLLERFILRDEQESVTFSFFLQFSSVIMLAPLLLFRSNFPGEIFPYLILLLVGVLDTLAVLLIKESVRLLEASFRTVIYQIRTFFVLIFAFFLLGESLSLNKVIGSIFIVSGIVIAVFQKRKINWFQKIFGRIFARKEQKTAGIFFTLAAALVTAFELMCLKYLLNQFAVGFTLFTVCLISTFLFLLVVPNLITRTLNLIRGEKRKLIFLNAFLANISWVLFFWATSMTEASKTQPISQGMTVLTILGGIIFLKERERVWQKILGGILAVIGVILVKGS